MTLRHISSLFLFLVLMAHATPGFSQNKARVQKQFEQWQTTSLWPDARKLGLSKSQFKQIFRGMKLQWKLPDLVIPGTRITKKKKQSQAEFRGPSVYFSEKNLVSQARTGRALLQKWQGTIKKIEQKYGVPGHFLLAIWGRESAFGSAKIPYSAIRVLATKAFMSTRKELFRKELLAALEIVRQERLYKGKLNGSWAGALGQPQFMPSSYLKYAVDFDGDGKRDIWNSVPDTLASIANYLSQHGWQKGRDWGFEANIPVNISCAQEGPDRARKISQWSKLGIRRVSGKDFPAFEKNKPGMMLVPAGRNGPHFVVTANFYVIKHYNNSDLYALFVGNLADRIAYGSGKFKTAWAAHEKLYRSDIARMQRKLENLGYDVGGADGLPGFKTRRSIGEWQIKSGAQSTCFPSSRLIRSIAG